MSEFKDYFGRPSRPHWSDEMTSTACDDQFALNARSRGEAITDIAVAMSPENWPEGLGGEKIDIHHKGYLITWGEYVQRRKELAADPWPEERMDVIGTNGGDGAHYDTVNRPSHYTQGDIECIDALEAATVGKSGIEAVCTANVIKYLWRYERKNGVEDVRKARWYLDRLIKELEQ